MATHASGVSPMVGTKTGARATTKIKVRQEQRPMAMCASGVSPMVGTKTGARAMTCSQTMTGTHQVNRTAPVCAQAKVLVQVEVVMFSQSREACEL